MNINKPIQLRALGRIAISCFAGIFVISLILLTACSKNAETGQNKPGAVSMSDSVLSADTVMIHYNTYGKGDKTLVFVHCWSCDCSYWDRQIDSFKDKYKVVTIDLAGHGRSGQNRKDWSIHAYGADVAAVVNKLGLHDIILIGHSMGGPVNIEAACLMPDIVTALVGVDTYQDLLLSYTEKEIEEWLGQFQSDFVGTTRNFIRNIFTTLADSALVEWVVNDMSSAPPDVAINSLKSSAQYNPAATLRDLDIPMRCINADLFPTNVEGNRTIVSSFEVKYMPGYGHFIQMENPEEFNRLLQETIDEFWPRDNQE